MPPPARLPPAEVEPAAPEIRKLAKETPSSANNADSPLRDMRLTGVPLHSQAPLIINIATKITGQIKDSVLGRRISLDLPLEGTGFEPSVPLLRKGLSAVAERRCRTDKLEGSLSTSRLARRAEGDPSRSTSLIFLNHHEHPSSSRVSAAACFVALWRGDWGAAENDAADCHRPDRQDDRPGTQALEC